MSAIVNDGGGGGGDDRGEHVLSNYCEEMKVRKGPCGQVLVLLLT